jgi:hypothetical protein
VGRSLSSAEVEASSSVSDSSPEMVEASSDSDSEEEVLGSMARSPSGAASKIGDVPTPSVCNKGDQIVGATQGESTTKRTGAVKRTLSSLLALLAPSISLAARSRER